MAARVLIIDDRHSEVWFMERVLQKLGYDVGRAFDGLEGLKNIKEQAPDLIILDTVMPKMDGYRVYQNLKINPDTADIPVLILTDRGEVYERSKLTAAHRKAMPAGKKNRALVNRAAKLDFLYKPVKSEDLARQVDNLLRADTQSTEDQALTGDRPRILIVDDDISLVRIIESVLREEGMDVITAFNGLAGLQKAKEELPDLIILDTIMPQLNGLQVLQNLRQHNRIPVVMIPGQAEADLLNKALVAGADGFVIKPFNPKTLLGFVKRKLKTPGLQATRSG